MPSTTPSTATESFILLADPDGYIACAWDLSRDAEGRGHWVNFFKRHLETILGLARGMAEARGQDLADVATRGNACRLDFHAAFDRFAADPDGDHGTTRVTILTLDTWRDAILRRHGFVDAFLDLKDRENAAALPMLPEVCRQIDAAAAEPADQLRAAIEGVFAGNIFDMGAEATAKAYLTGGPDFFAIRQVARGRGRGWWTITTRSPPACGAAHAAQEGGVLHRQRRQRLPARRGTPMMRWLAMPRYARWCMAANERPTLNDMTDPRHAPRGGRGCWRSSRRWRDAADRARQHRHRRAVDRFVGRVG